MSRTAHLFAGLGFTLLCAFWGLICFVWFISNAVGRDSVPGASIFDSSFLIIYLVAVGGLVCGLWLAFRSFRRAFRTPRCDLPAPSASAEAKRDLATSDEKLAHLVKRNSNDDVV
jgi:hypothetical protein